MDSPTDLVYDALIQFLKSLLKIPIHIEFQPREERTSKKIFIHITLIFHLFFAIPQKFPTFLKCTTLSNGSIDSMSSL